MPNAEERTFYFCLFVYFNPSKLVNYQLNYLTKLVLISCGSNVLHSKKSFTRADILCKAFGFSNYLTNSSKANIELIQSVLKTTTKQEMKSASHCVVFVEMKIIFWLFFHSLLFTSINKEKTVFLVNRLLQVQLSV